MNPRNRNFWHLSFAAALTFCLLAIPGSAQQVAKKKTPPGTAEARAAGSESGKREADNVRARDAWFYRQRAFPLGHIPGGARQRALDRKEEMRRAQREAQARAGLPGEAKAPATGNIPATGPFALSTSTWTHVGPMPAMSADFGVGFVSGRVSAIAVDPTNANTVFVGGAQGGVWKSTDGGTTWATTFDDSNSLAIGAIAIDPNNPSTIYVGTGEQNFSGDSYYGAGIYKSTDGGATWNQIPGETITNTMAGEPTSFLPPAAPFNEVVGGVHISALVVHPTNPNKLFAGVQIFENVDGGVSSGLYCSDDSGAHWTQLLSGAIGTDVQIHPFNGGAVGYAALGSPNGDISTNDLTGQNGVYKSTQANSPCTNQVPGQAGAWTPVSKAPMPLGVNAGLIRLGVAPSDPMAKTVYAAVTTPTMADALAGVFRTIDGGTSWTPITPTPDFCAPQCSYDMVVKVHPNDANTVFLGGSRAFSGAIPFFLIRTNNGLSATPTWTGIAQDTLGNVLHVDQHALAFGLAGTGSPKIYVGNDGGIWSTPLATPSAAVTWNNLNNGLEMIQFYPGISIDPGNNQVAYAGSQDNGTDKMDPSFNPANPFEWNELPPCGDGGYTAVDPSSPTTVYTGCENVDVEKSMNSGLSFTEIDTNGINSSDRSEFIAPLVLDNANPLRLYFGTFRVWQTTSGGNSWTAISPDLSNTNPSNLLGGVPTDDLTSISVSPVDPNVVYAGTFESLVWRTTNANLGAGATWTQIDGISTANPTLPGRIITQVAADPNNRDTVFVTMSGFGGFLAGDTGDHVFKCNAVARTCAPITSGATPLPNVPVNAMFVDPMDPLSNTIIIGTDIGVFGTTDGGNTWIADYPGTTIPNGLPDVAVLGMAVHTGSRVLRVVTHGRGAWDLQLPGLAAYAITSISPSSAATGTIGPVVLTVSGNGFSATSTVLFNNVAHAPTSQTTTQLKVNLTTADLATSGMVNVQVSDPAQAAPGLTNIVTFSITTPVPTVSSIAPTSTAVNTAVPNMVVTGTNFIGTSVVRINNNGGGISDTLVPSSITGGGTTINVTVPANAQSVMNAGTYFISVFNPPPGGGDSSQGAGTPPNFTVTPANNNPPPNDNFANASACAGTGTCDTTNNVNATTQNTDPLPSCVQGIAPPFNPVNGGAANSIWYSFTATGPGNVEADTIGSLDDTILDVVTGSPGAFTEVACNDDIISGVTRTSQVNFTATQGATYFFMVSSFQGLGGKIIFNLNATISGATDFMVSAPNPTSQTVTRGNSGVTILTVTPNAALFPGNVTFSCSGLPTLSACLFNPTTVMQNAGATPVTVTITTMAPTLVPPVPRRSPGPWSLGPLLWISLAVAMLAMLAARRMGTGWRYALSVGVLAIFAGLAVACGGGGGGGGTGGGSPGSLPLGPNNVMITATSGIGAGKVMHTVQFTLTLQ